MKEDPSKMVKISKGETLAILKLHKYATTTGGSIDPQYFTWNIVLSPIMTPSLPRESAKSTMAAILMLILAVSTDGR